MTEYLLIILVTFVIIYALIKGCNININVTIKQEISEDDRQLLEDMYNSDGDMKNREAVMMEALDNAVRNINNIMLDVEDDTNG
ncbi:MAG: hypothetical protein J6Y02_15180 [Pseudobutyrivibrio sp.]|nr:hypothetical protein [Pseudobutyrivibrio sp.]